MYSEFLIRTWQMSFWGFKALRPWALGLASARLQRYWAIGGNLLRTSACWSVDSRARGGGKSSDSGSHVPLLSVAPVEFQSRFWLWHLPLCSAHRHGAQGYTGRWRHSWHWPNEFCFSKSIMKGTSDSILFPWEFVFWLGYQESQLLLLQSNIALWSLEEPHGMER